MKEQLFVAGHSACAGCGCALTIRTVMENLGKNTIVCENTGCMEVVSSPYPRSSWKVPWIHVCFENAAAVASGVARALKRQGKEDVTVVALGGDGSTYDIGFGHMSGAFERGENILYICYDNEAYMNTGVQRSGGTPLYASATTSPAGKVIKGKQEWKKDLPFIVTAHHIPYVATASIGYPQDLKKKLEKAMKIKGPRYLHIFASCPVGWGCDSALSIDYAKKAVDTGMWPLYEVENGVGKLTYEPKQLVHMKDYVKGQRRYRHLSEEDVEKLDKMVKEHYEKTKARLECLKG